MVARLLPAVTQFADNRTCGEIDPKGARQQCSIFSSVSFDRQSEMNAA
jgi:hypothetical protein